MAAGGQQYDTQRLNAKVKTLLGRELKSILRDLDLPVSGSKATMQDRLLSRIRDTAHSGDTISYNRVKKLISPDIPTFAPAQPNPAGYDSPQPQHHSQLSGSASYGTYPAHRPPMAGQHPSSSLSFKDSPFYDILEPLSQVLECKVRETTRDTLVIKLPLQEPVIQRLQQDPNIRIMLFGAVEDHSHSNSKALNPFVKHDISFPHQVDLKVNLDEVKANLKGLKNKQGTTRPADLTHLLRKIPRYENEIRLTYALTHKKYYIMVNLVRKKDIQELVKKLQEGTKSVSKDQVMREMRTKAQDPDIVTTSTVMSLKCPLSTLRIQVPCRGYTCNHNQCFDASAFLQLQEQGPTWSCPICNKTATNDLLMVDKYVEDILTKTKQSVEQVTIEPDGTWSENVASDNSFISKGASASSPDDDDDLVEIHDMRVNALKMEATPRSSPLHRTPPASSREQSTASSRPSSNKRPASSVIDLTLSDDEEDSVAPRPKRPSYASSTSGGLPLLNGERESSTSALYNPNTVPGGITFGIPNNIGRPFYPQQYR